MLITHTFSIYLLYKKWEMERKRSQMIQGKHSDLCPAHRDWKVENLNLRCWQETPSLTWNAKHSLCRWVELHGRDQKSLPYIALCLFYIGNITNTHSNKSNISSISIMIHVFNTQNIWQASLRNRLSKRDISLIFSSTYRNRRRLIVAVTWFSQLYRGNFLL